MSQSLVCYDGSSYISNFIGQVSESVVQRCWWAGSRGGNSTAPLNDAPVATAVRPPVGLRLNRAESTTSFYRHQAAFNGIFAERNTYRFEMTPSLLRPQVHLTNTEALKLAQLAPEVLKSNPKVFSASPLGALFSASETGDVWTIYENLLLACLRTGDDRAASECLERIVIRFGATDERVMALEGLTKEAKALNNNDLDKILKEYDAILKENDANVVSEPWVFAQDTPKANSECSPLPSAELLSSDRWANSPSRLLPSTPSSNSTPRMPNRGLSWPRCTWRRGYMRRQSTHWRRFWCSSQTRGL